MSIRDKLDLNRPSKFDLIVNYRHVWLLLIVIISIFFLTQVRSLPTDPTLRSGLDQTSSSYKEYSAFLDDFGDEEFILVSLHNSNLKVNPELLSALKKITAELETYPKIMEVISVSNLKLFQKVDEKFGNAPILVEKNGVLQLPEANVLQEMKTALPTLELLVSNDRLTYGILLRLEENSKYDTDFVRKLSIDIKDLSAKYSPVGTDCRVVGSPLIRQAIVRYNIQTGIVFGSLCMLIGTVVSIYVFKSIRITIITNVILSICVLWVLGLMAVFRIPLNSTTALSFGFIPIVTVEIVIHMVVRYYQFLKETHESIGAIKKAVRWLARPSFICSTTTAVGFGTLMVSSIPMVKQLGFIMSLGIILSYGLAMVLTPTLFLYFGALSTKRREGQPIDWMDGVLRFTSRMIFSYHRYIVEFGIVLTILLFSGAPFIKSDTQILRMLSDTTPEVQDIAYVEKHLTAVHGVELVVEAEPDAFKKAALWKKIAELTSALQKIPEVTTVDSFLPLLEYIDQTSTGKVREDYFADPSLLPQLLMITGLSADGERIRSRHLDSDFSKLHIPIRIKNSPDVPIGTTINEIRSVAAKVMNGSARPVLTGELTVVADQTAELIDDQMKSMFLAAVLITILMMIQMESITLGLICLIPNIPPVAAVFGIMGWFGISLDSITVFAATVAIGLAVDNTIHFLTQLKRDIALNPNQEIEAYVQSAYNLTARQIASWSVVTLFGFLALSVSPFRPVVFFGILGCSSIILGLFGDLIFMQSLILTSKGIRNTIERLIRKQIAREGIGTSDMDEIKVKSL